MGTDQDEGSSWEKVTKSLGNGLPRDPCSVLRLRRLNWANCHRNSNLRGDPDFWTRVLRQVEDEAIRGRQADDWTFDTLIVDEAQDFEGDWFEVARLVLRDAADVLWLEDPNQNLRGITAPDLRAQGFVGYRSMLNDRSPERIARFIAATLPELPFTCANDLPGLGVGVTTYEDPAEQPRLAGRLIGRLMAERFPARDIAILSCRGLEGTVLKGVERVANHRLARFTGDYDLFGNQIYSQGQVLFDTVRRFKGQQAAAVILTDVDPRPDRLPRELQILFCGMTRATVRLEILCNGASPWVSDRLLPAGGG